MALRESKINKYKSLSSPLMEEIALKHKQICFLINRFAVPSVRLLRAGSDWPTLQKIGAQVSQLDDKNKVLIFQN